MLENREISIASGRFLPERSGKACGHKPDVNAMEKSDIGVLCAGQRSSQEGQSPSGSRMRGAISKSGGNASLAGESE